MRKSLLSGDPRRPSGAADPDLRGGAVRRLPDDAVTGHLGRGAAAIVTSALATMLMLSACSGHGTSSQAAMVASNRMRPQTYGREALESESHRIIEVKAGDDLRFDPAEITVRAGETVTFHIVNTGRQEHEFTVGDPDAQELHEYQMASMNMASMGHGAMARLGKQHERYMQSLARRISELDRLAAANASVHIPPGETRNITWAFTSGLAPTYGCHIPGHWAAGMKGSLLIS